MPKPAEQRYWYGAWRLTSVRQAIGPVGVSLTAWRLAARCAPPGDRP